MHIFGICVCADEVRAVLAAVDAVQSGVTLYLRARAKLVYVRCKVRLHAWLFLLRRMR